MTDYVIAPPRQPSVAVAGDSRRFPVRRIFCVGRNYAAHVREMGNDEREPPFFFSKPGDAVVDGGSRVPYPPLTKNLHHEIELVVAIGREGARIRAAEALGHVFGYAAGVDLTRRDLQDQAKEMRRPWDWSKGFDASAVCGTIRPATSTAKPESGRIWLAVNGVVRQDADLSEMIWPVADVIAFCSEAVVLRPGDLIYTGTPAGVGPLLPGDHVSGGVDGVGTLETVIAG